MTAIWFPPSTFSRLFATWFMHHIRTGYRARHSSHFFKARARTGRTAVFKEYNENAGGNRHPMRGVETPEYLYLFNPWSDGEDIMRTATQGTKTYKRMKELAPSFRGNPKTTRPF